MRFITPPRLSLLIFLFTCAPAIPAQDQLIPPGATWKYLDDGSDQGTAWRAPSFDDSAWASGPAQLGYGDGDEATVVSYGPSSGNKYITTWFRHAFQVTRPTPYLAGEVRLLRDDGAVVYLNGVEVVRDNMPSTQIGHRTLAASTVGGAGEDTFYSLTIPSSAFLVGRNVLAVEIHQRSVTSSDISFDLELLGHTEPVITRGPYLQNGTTSSVSVRWRTNVPTDSRVLYGSSPGSLTQSVSSTTATTEHVLRITSLQPDARTYYAVGTSTAMLAGGTADYTFLTYPPAGTRRPARYWILGDSGTTGAYAPAVRDAYHAFNGTRHTDLWLMLGDNAKPDGTDAQFQAAVFDVFPATLRRSVLYSCRGNHERHASVYYDIHTFPTTGEAGGVPSWTEAWYSFDHANVHFICLDSYGSDVSVGGAMWTWLQNDLNANTQDWTVAFFHHPPYTKGSHDSDTESRLIEMRRDFNPLLESGGVDLVICGHSHVYERSFLMDGHYGHSSSFTDAMKKDPGNGRPASDGAYHKAPMSHAGAIYAVMGSSSTVGGGSLDHPVMLSAMNVPGSLVLDVDGETMEVTFLDDNGAIRDHFTMVTHAGESLRADTTTLSTPTAATQTFSLDAGVAQAGRLYLLLGSRSTAPGISLGGFHLPLNADPYFFATFEYPNSPLLGNTLAALDAQGRSTATFNLPAGLGAVLNGETFFHAYAVFDIPGSGAMTFTSNAFPVTFLPW